MRAIKLKACTGEKRRDLEPRFVPADLTIWPRGYLKLVFRHSHWPRAMWWSADLNYYFFFLKAAQPRFSPVADPFWVQVEVRVRVRVGVKVRVRGWVRSTPAP